MTRTNGKLRGFTLVELLVVIAMIVVIMGAMTTSIAGAQKRARIQKATNDVKIITEAILGYENFAAAANLTMPTMKDAKANGSDSLKFLLGQGGSTQAGEIPVLLMASLQTGGDMLDPWGMPYLVSIIKSQGSLKAATSSSSLQTGYYLPNFNRLKSTERTIWTN